MSRLVVVAVLSAVMAACTPEKAVEPSESASTARPVQPNPDLSTPDRALKSYWAQKDWQERLRRQTDDEIRKKVAAKLPTNTEVYAPVVTAELLAYWRWRDKQTGLYQDKQREIESVKQETESRAVALVRIRNVSPIPEGAKPEPWQIKARQRGEMFRYVIEKEGPDWKIAEVWENREGPLGPPLKLYSDLTPGFPAYVLGE